MFAALLFVAIVAHAGASAVRKMPGDVCACALKESMKTCYKLDRPNEAPVEAKGKSNGPVKCVAFPCPAYYDCVEHSTTYCIMQKVSKDKLVPSKKSKTEGSGNPKSINDNPVSINDNPVSINDKTIDCKLQSADDGDMKLTLYTEHPEEEDDAKIKERSKRKLLVKNFKFTFAGTSDCWAFRGDAGLGEFHDAAKVHEFDSMSTGKCEPIKIMCTDTSAEGPAIVGFFEADEFCDGSGKNQGIMFASNDARQNGLAPEFGVAEAMKHKWVRGADMTHSDDHARKCFEKYPEWKKRFLTKAVPVHVPYNANKQGTCTFMFVPPYCEQNAA